MLNYLSSLTGGGGMDMSGGDPTTTSTNTGGTYNVNMSKSFGGTGLTSNITTWAVIGLIVLGVLVWLKKSK